MMSDPHISGGLGAVKFEDSCDPKTSLGVSNDVQFGQVLAINMTKTKFYEIGDDILWRQMS